MKAPLAERLRPKQLSDYIGQDHLVGKDGLISKIIKQQSLPSLIFWGPPGIGKTTLAQIIANEINRPFYKLSAINSGVKDIRSVIQKAKQSQGMFSQNSPILFIDEIHRFSKSQQDSLLEAVEKAWVTLIGATTENPSFEVISALLSRCQIYTLKSFGKEELETLLDKALTEDSLLKNLDIQIKEKTALFRMSGGDARKLLNVLELIVTQQNHKDKIIIRDELVYKVVQEKPLKYDKSGEQHYDIISAFIKSIRGSDPNAAVYWLARMLEGGEDIKFIARRLIILASEDIGLANPTALVMANNTFQAINVIGMPEARIILSQCVIYLATSPKSNSAYMAINKAMDLVTKTGDLEVPLSLRNAPTQLMKDLDYGKSYPYAHDYDGNFAFHDFMPKEISSENLYTTSDNSREKQNKDFLNKRWKGKYEF
ncbi:replication-associated recombination protein A [Mesohalobacter halotolerans]|jgi:putative ATPase|uniref:Replication-associated recombination protein A n=1 Tax=Mesohalobacter halotolerans TaxID=1883405 RepID=A0A4U5TUL0_9FLAO|nr:replication-associated recombination protein A [Mesohalobacter halotolerans]TKS57631.1 replication-associated recombination protein A [Mesohalobacter halotolerans]